MLRCLGSDEYGWCMYCERLRKKIITSSENFGLFCYASLFPRSTRLEAAGPNASAAVAL